MRRTSRLLVLFGIGLAVLTFVLIVALLPNNGTPGTGRPGATPTPAPNVNVVVAAQDIGLGVVVTADMLTTQSVPRAAAATDAFLVPSQVIGQTVRRPIVAGAQVHKADFDLNPALETLTVPPGKRAMAISVTELTGVGKLIHIGDTVDVVVTFDEATIKILTIQPGSQNAQHDDNFRPLSVKAPLLLQDIQVIGTIDSPPAGAAANPQPSQATEPTITNTNKLIVLAVTDDQAEAILFARYGGTIDLVLRSPADEGTTATTEGVILKTMFEKYGVLPPYIIKQFPIFVPQQP